MLNIKVPFSEILAEIKKTFVLNAEERSRIQAFIPDIILQRWLQSIIPHDSVHSKIKEIISDIASPLDDVLKSVEPLIARVKVIEREHGSITNYLDKLIEARHQVLAEHGWFYAFGISDDLADEIYNQRAILTQDIIDTAVICYFKDDDYKELSRIVASWKDSPYFVSRQHIFKEAVVNHMQGRFYSSVTLLSVHTEGIGFDYTRKRGVQSIVASLAKALDKNPDVYFSDIERKMLFDFLRNVFCSDYWDENPELQPPKNNTDIQEVSHNLSRHKIAHGQVIDGLSEADSLKCFLYLNALFHLLIELERGGDGDE